MHKIAMFPNSSGSRYWRLEDPAKYLRKLGHEVVLFEEPPTREMCEYFDMYVTQGMVAKDSIALMYEYQQEHGKKIVVDQDDDLKVSNDNPHKKDHQVTNAAEVIKKTLEIADLVTTTNAHLQRKLSQYNPNVVEFQNYMDLDRWDIPTRHHSDSQIRIFWAGSITHMEDLKMVLPVLQRIQREYQNVKFIFMGEPRIKKYVEGLNIEIMLGVPFEAYPSKLHSIGADIAIAPLVDNEFNQCKSPIKFLEYAISKYAGVYSDTVYVSHAFDGSCGTIASNLDQWYLALRNYIVCPQLRHDIAERAYNYVKSWYSLDLRIKQLEKAYKKLWTSSVPQVSVNQPDKENHYEVTMETLAVTQVTLNP